MLRTVLRVSMWERSERCVSRHCERWPTVLCGRGVMGARGTERDPGHSRMAGTAAGRYRCC